ncbi:PREDICTED: uncharacterized protein LOC101301018 [Fragaria vesca subsp. vesca]|uniref:uncharacterized protein LOC101301018 n=1 Tax=Fragaria vesca subsp. vesca TaxID=101020 RepID=UPI0002C35AB6|nr:PREDICTED: uncharacterized protein LOC101301018 [Fragaria vesca subsp. vesca]
MSAPKLLLGPPKPSNTTTNTATKPPMGRTEKSSATYLSSGNPCLDLFFHIVPDTPSSYINEQLPKSWAHNALTTLKLICNLRGVRGTGKSDKEDFFTAAFWLHNNHPKTLACNLASFASFGCFKDLPEILFRLMEGQDIRKNRKAESHSRSRSKTASRRAFKSRTNKGKRMRYSSRQEPREERVVKATEKAKSEKEKASVLRKQKFADMANKAISRYERDPDYRFLHEKVSDLFATCLKSDLESLKSNERKNISLAAKWCPSLDSSFDRATLLCETIAKKVFPRELFHEYDGVLEEHYRYRVRDRLRKEVLVPLRKALELPEVYMGAQKWRSLPYNRVPSVAMKLYKDTFFKYDIVRFSKYLVDAKAGKTTIAAGALLPHEIIASNANGSDGVAELQWKRLVEDMVKKGKMKNCLAVCDVSGSMGGLPMDVSVALGLLVSELSEKPWKGKVITFSEKPELHFIKGEDLGSKCKFMRDMKAGFNTDFQKVFDLILRVAVKGNLKPDEMIKRVFVFSDMEFDEANPESTWETDYEAIQRKFKRKGYGDVVPQIVFWNLRHSESTPVTEKQPGVAMLSGFSKNLLKLFLNNDGEVNPNMAMELAISGDEYQKLAVVD